MFKVEVNYKEESAHYIIAEFIKNYIDENSIIVCIGTDRCIGDCLGPLVGTLLKEKRFPLPVVGTTSQPIHALNLSTKLEEIKALYPTQKVLAIDACLGKSKDIGDIQARNYSIHPGRGVGKTLPEVGTASIIGIVDSSDNNELFTNRNIRLDLILNMANVIVEALFQGIYIKESEAAATT